MSQELPHFLETPDAFATHLYEQFDDASNQEKGDRFLAFAMTLIAFIDDWKSLAPPVPSKKKTHDGGVDFTSMSEDGDVCLCGQSKFRIREIADIDEIVSKFQNYETQQRAKTGDKQRPLAFDDGSDNSERELEFVVVTPVSLKGLLERYRNSNLTGRAYLGKLEDSARIKFLDRDEILPVLRRAYRQNYVPEPEIQLEFASDVIQVGNVLLSTVSGRALRELYERHGSSLFLRILGSSLAFRPQESLEKVTMTQ